MDFLAKKMLLNVINGILADYTLAKPVTFEERHLRFSPPPTPLLNLTRDIDCL